VGHKAAKCTSKPIHPPEELDKTCQKEDVEEHPMWLLMHVQKDDDDFEIVRSNKMKDTKSIRKEESDEKLCIIEDIQGNWGRVSASMDSRVSTTVIPKRMFPKLQLKQTEAWKQGKKYAAANEGKIRHEGENIVPFTTQGMRRRRYEHRSCM